MILPMALLRRKTVKGGKVSAPMSVTAKSASGSKAAGGSEQAPTRDEIARRAYEIYLGRGGLHGADEQDWLRAESELRGK
jgi:hypothetical protein